MALSELWNVLKSVIDCESKIEHGDFVFEYCSSLLVEPSSDLTADLFSIDVYGSSEFSFSKFLSSNFVKQPFILVSKERRSSVVNNNLKDPFTSSINENRSQKISSRTDSQKSNISDSEVWGSPLKNNIPTDEESLGLVSFDSYQLTYAVKKRIPKRTGIPLSWARKILSAFNINSSCTINHPSVVVLCDAADFRCTAVCGVRMFRHLSAKREAKGFVTVTVTVDEKGCLDDWNAKVKMDGDQSQACHAVYQVNTGPLDMQEPWGSVAVEIRWKGASHLLEIPPSEAITTVKASVKSGSMQSSMSSYYHELQFLIRIVTAFTTDQLEWVLPSSDKPTVPLTTAVKTLIETLKEEGTLSSAAAKSEADVEAWTFATALKTFIIEERKDYDFTDRLWKEMLNCMSTDDLISSLRLVFKALGKGQLQPFVDRHNKTTVAQMVRESFTGRFSAPSLTGIQPFLFLAEMGAEKLRRDYIHIFVSQGLATPSTLESFTATERELQAKVDDLYKLHCILEMVALLGTSLHLPPDTLGNVAHQMLSYYQQNLVNPQQVFNFSVKTSEVCSVLSGVRPAMWCVETCSKVTETVSESSLYCLCATQPFLHLFKEAGATKEDNSVQLEEGTKNTNTAQYCLVQRKESVIIL